MSDEDLFEDPLDIDDGFAAKIAEFGEIGARLRAPRESLALAEFAERLRRVTIVCRVAGWGRLVGDHAFLGRLRGAFGTVLAETASGPALDGRPCRWSPPCAFEALFRKPGRMTPGTDFPSPWVFEADGRRGDLEVGLTLFGMAADWAPAAAEAFTVALRRVDRSGEAGLFLPAAEIVDRRITAAEGVAGTAPSLTGFRIETLTPLVSAGATAIDDPASVFTTFGRRLEGLARWHEATLDADLSAVAADLRAAEWQWTALEETRWRRGSRRQGGRVVPMGGLLGRLTMATDVESAGRLAPLFRLAEAIHAGADIAFGCGRLRVTELDRGVSRPPRRSPNEAMEEWDCEA